MGRVLYTLLVVSFVSFNALGQSPEEWRQSEHQQETNPTEKNRYNGVTPGSGNSLPAVATLRDKTGIWVTWPGFTTSPAGGTRLFIQTTALIKYTIREQREKRIVIDLKNASIFLGNNRNPLVTTHFNTPLRKAYLKRRGKRVELVLEMKVASTPEISQTTNADGYSYIFIDFPSGTYPTQPSNNPKYSDQ